MFLVTSSVILSTLLPLIASQCACNFSDVQRQNRDTICLKDLNWTLYQHIDSVNKRVSSSFGVAFHLDEVLKNQSFTNESSTDFPLLDFVAMGGLEAINWKTAVGYDSINATSTDIYMENTFVIPVKDDLQKLVLNYSFPYGIFRQIEPLPNYVGLNTTDNSSRCYCTAGGELTLTFTTNASIDLDIHSSSFADFSRTVEKKINVFMTDYDAFKQSFIYCRVQKVERPGASPALVYLGLVFTEAVEPSVAQHLGNITDALPQVVWAKSLAKAGFVNLYNGTTTTTTTTSTTPMTTTTEAETVAVLPDPRKLRVSQAYISNKFEGDRLNSREIHILAIGVGGFVGLFFGLLLLLLGSQLRMRSSKKPDNITSNKT